MNRPAEMFLACVRHKQTGLGRWVFHVPTREDRTPSGVCTELEDGRILIHDFAGDSTEEILAAVGLTMTDLFPRGPLVGHGRPRSIPAADALRCIATEALLVAVAAVSLQEGQTLSTADRDRVGTAAGRIYGALDACGLHKKK